MLFGPLTISAYLELFSQVAQKKRDEVGKRSGEVASLIELYDRLGCGKDELVAAIECVSATMFDSSNKTPIRERAQKCMLDSGMAVR